MTAPTEEEIRTAIEGPIRDATASLHEHLAHHNAMDAITDSDMALTRRGWADGFHPQEGHPGTLWADLTADEASALHFAINQALDQIPIAELITAAVVAAAVEFAELFPDVPRGRWRAAREAVAT